MSWVLLGLGVAAWWAGHLFKRVAPDLRAPMGDKGKGLVALALVAAIVLMTIGYRMAPYVPVWFPPAWTVHLNNLAVLIAIYLMSPAPKYGRLVHGWRHPMLVGFGLWAGAHLAVNGDLASLVLFGGLLAWVPAAIVAINRAEPAWAGRAGSGKLAMDGAFVLASAVLLAIVGYIHWWLGVWPFPA